MESRQLPTLLTAFIRVRTPPTITTSDRSTRQTLATKQRFEDFRRAMKGEQQKMRVVVGGSLWLWLWVLAMAVGVSEGGDLAAKCNLLVQKVLPCLNFATGQAAVPTKECCEATLDIKKSDPECLCFAIQQTHKGSPEVKSMGIQEGRLLQLPSACNLKNASTTNCPKLLGLSPNSPDAAIFRNASLRMNSSSTVGSATPVSHSSHKASFGTMLRPSLVPHLPALFCAILILLLPISSVNINLFVMGAFN